MMDDWMTGWRIILSPSLWTFYETANYMPQNTKFLFMFLNKLFNNAMQQAYFYRRYKQKLNNN